MDARKSDDFEKGFVPGSLNIGLNGQYAVWVGTLIDINRPLVLVTDSGKEQEAVLRLARVGYENVLGFLEGGIESWSGPRDIVRSVTASDIPAILDQQAAVLDVRRPGEWKISHLAGAQLVPLSDMPGNVAHLDRNKTYVVHCGGGYRSMTAISLMKQQGFRNLINVYGGFAAMTNAGLEVVTDSENVTSASWHG